MLAIVHPLQFVGGSEICNSPAVLVQDGSLPTLRSNFHNLTFVHDSAVIAVVLTRRIAIDWIRPPEPHQLEL